MADGRRRRGQPKPTAQPALPLHEELSGYSPWDPQELEAYASETSVAAGGTIGFHVSVLTPTDDEVVMEVFRSSQCDFGDSQFGLQADHIYTRDFRDQISVRDGEEPEAVGSFPPETHPLPDAVYDVGCGWPEAIAWDVPPDLPSNVYLARFTHADATAYALFVVRAAEPDRHAPILCQISANTHQAYNPWGGFCYYGAPISRSGPPILVSTVSFNRPCQLWDYVLYDQPIVTWLDRNYPVEFCTNVDLHIEEQLLENRQLFVSCGHDEYWSELMRDRIEGFASRGGNVMFLSGNTCFRPVNFEGRRMHLLAGTWDDYGRPTAYTTGVNLSAGHWSQPLPLAGYTVELPSHWAFEGTGLEPGATLGEEDGIIGYECDAAIRSPDGTPIDPTPADFVTVASASLPDWVDGPGFATMGLFRRDDNGVVMTASTTGWGQGLRTNEGDVDRVTRNLVERLRWRFGAFYAVTPDGDLWWYRDRSADGTGDVAGGQVIGHGGWAGFRWVFGGGSGVIYAVSLEGDLVWYRDHNRDGSGDVANGQVVGRGGWDGFRRVFAGSDGVIYAVTEGGDLASTRDDARDGTGDVPAPQVISSGGWDAFRVVFAGDEGIVYGITPDGGLVWHWDENPGDARLLGQGWDGVKAACSGGDGMIYATTEAGDLLWGRDRSRDGTGDVSPPSTVGRGGWDAMLWLASGA